MNKMQRGVLIASGAVVLMMLLYPPYLSNQGTDYAFLFAPPWRATVNVATLIVQWLGVSIVGGIAYFILKTK